MYPCPQHPHDPTCHHIVRHTETEPLTPSTPQTLISGSDERLDLEDMRQHIEYAGGYHEVSACPVGTVQALQHGRMGLCHARVGLVLGGQGMRSMPGVLS